MKLRDAINQNGTVIIASYQKEAIGSIIEEIEDIEETTKSVKHPFKILRGATKEEFMQQKKTIGFNSGNIIGYNYFYEIGTD